MHPTRKESNADLKIFTVLLWQITAVTQTHPISGGI